MRFDVLRLGASRLALLMVAGSLVACSAEQPAAPSQPATPAEGESDVLPFSAVKGLSLASSPFCRAAAYRQFDFWLGQWDITEDGGPAGSNIVEPILGGCAIRENYVDPWGTSSGTSLNSYDADTKQWRQTWVSDYGTEYRMAGGLDATGTMVLLGQRINAANGRLLLDTWKWTPIDGNNVLQTGRVTVPATGVDNQFFNGEYHRVPSVTQPEVIPSGLCDASPATDADFLAGSWNVKGPFGVSLGRSVTKKSISGCLVEEHFTGRLGYEAIAFTYRDPITRKWYRSTADNLGERLELEGDVVGGVLVLTGVEKVAGQELQVRLTLTPAGGKIAAKHEVSRDGGATWVMLATLSYGN